MIEYRVPDFAEWKAVFDRDPMGREHHGVTHHWIYQSADDANHVMLSLQFASAEQAATFRQALQPVWDVSGARQAWVLHQAEGRAY